MRETEPNWKIVEPVFDLVREAHHRRLDENGPGMVAQVDQEVARTQEFLRPVGTTISRRDMFFLLLGLAACWDITVAAEEKGLISLTEAETTITVTSTAAVNLLLATYPRWLDKRDAA
jgi:hypothetical protein